jgi:hypothetical protein
MAPNLLFYQLLVIALVLICLLLHVWWPHPPKAIPQMPHKPDKPRRQRSTDPKPFPGLIHKPLCVACEQGGDTRPKAPGSPPPILTCTRGRRRTVDTHAHFCPAPQCAYRGWLGRGNIRATLLLDWVQSVLFKAPNQAISLLSMSCCFDQKDGNHF